jgi:hypothetical protein
VIGGREPPYTSFVTAIPIEPKFCFLFFFERMNVMVIKAQLEDFQ